VASARVPKLPVEAKLPLAGSYSSAVAFGLLKLSMPPVRVLPAIRRVAAVVGTRAAHAARGAKLPLAGSYSSVLAPGSVLFTPLYEYLPIIQPGSRVWAARSMLPVALKPCGIRQCVTSSVPILAPTPSSPSR